MRGNPLHILAKVLIPPRTWDPTTTRCCKTVTGLRKMKRMKEAEICLWICRKMNLFKQKIKNPGCSTWTKAWISTRRDSNLWKSLSLSIKIRVRIKIRREIRNCHRSSLQIHMFGWSGNLALMKKTPSHPSWNSVMIPTSSQQIQPSSWRTSHRQRRKREWAEGNDTAEVVATVNLRWSGLIMSTLLNLSISKSSWMSNRQSIKISHLGSENQDLLRRGLSHQVSSPEREGLTMSSINNVKLSTWTSTLK